MSCITIPASGQCSDGQQVKALAEARRIKNTTLALGQDVSMLPADKADLSQPGSVMANRCLIPNTHYSPKAPAMVTFDAAEHVIASPIKYGAVARFLSPTQCAALPNNPPVPAAALKSVYFEGQLPVNCTGQPPKETFIMSTTPDNSRRFEYDNGTQKMVFVEDPSGNIMVDEFSGF